MASALPNSLKTIISLCDYTGNWSQPYLDAGYNVVRVDLQHGQDLRLFEARPSAAHGILAAPPCTAFASSGAQYWAEKDQNGETLHGLSLVDACMRIILVHKPQWWALENPVGRLKDYLGQPVFSFDPCDFGDPYRKKTLLWGNFTPPTLRPVHPSASSHIMELGGTRDLTKVWRSATPPGFAQAFFKANP